MFRLLQKNKVTNMNSAQKVNIVINSKFTREQLDQGLISIKLYCNFSGLHFDKDV